MKAKGLFLLFLASLVLELTSGSFPRNLIKRLEIMSVNTDVILPETGFIGQSHSFIRNVSQIGLERQPSSHLSRRSICPWHYVKNIDPTRYPVELFEARCDQAGPCHCGGEAPGRSRSRCTEVALPHFVIRRIKRDGQTAPGYRLTKELLGAGCACASPEVRESQHSHGGLHPDQ
ncbi:interleukin-17A-like [Liolophura sinensis]|uniref:interleukin-17A-like n=1 Tax=Liolophura sinensis TaxID=3198878 RepID=UPI00315836B5